MRVKLRDALVGYERRGRGAALVLLHAFPLDRRMWERTADELSHDADVLAVDFPGLGESGLRSVGLDEAADDVAALLDLHGIDRAVVAGVSMGGYVALGFAERHGGRLAGLLLADTRATADTAEQRAARDAAIARVARDGSQQYVAELVPRLVAAASLGARDLALAIAGLQDPMGIAGALAAMRDRPDRSAMLASIRVPTTIVVGALDEVTPPDEARRLAAAIAGAELVEIAGAGHLCAMEDPAAFAAAARALLARSGPPSR